MFEDLSPRCDILLRLRHEAYWRSWVTGKQALWATSWSKSSHISCPLKCEFLLPWVLHPPMTDWTVFTCEPEYTLLPLNQFCQVFCHSNKRTSEHTSVIVVSLICGNVNTKKRRRREVERPKGKEPGGRGATKEWEKCWCWEWRRKRTGGHDRCRGSCWVP